MKPQITVLMPVYNAEAHLREAIDSILNQTFTDFEFLIIDDGSTDNSKSIVASYQDARIRFVANENNLGISATLNKGIQLASCELIARMDADDISVPERLERQFQYFQTHTNCAFVSSWFRRFNNDGTEDRLLKHKPEHFYYYMLYNNWINHSSVMYKRSAVIDVGMYDKFYAEDFNLWSKLFRKYQFHNIPEVLVHYRISENSLSRGLRRTEYIQAHLEQMIENIHFYTGNNFPINIAEAEFLRGTKTTLSMSQKDIFDCFQKLDFITECVLKRDNANKISDALIKEAAATKKRTLLSKLGRQIGKRRMLLIMLQLGYFNLLSLLIGPKNQRFTQTLRSK